MTYHHFIMEKSNNQTKKRENHFFYRIPYHSSLRTGASCRNYTKTRKCTGSQTKQVEQDVDSVQQPEHLLALISKLRQFEFINQGLKPVNRISSFNYLVRNNLAGNANFINTCSHFCHTITNTGSRATIHPAIAITIPVITASKPIKDKLPFDIKYLDTIPYPSLRESPAVMVSGLR